jgi:ADP-ribosylglycohydrolase
MITDVHIDIARRAQGSLLGLAIGDALGGPTEGMAQEAIAARWGKVTDFLTELQGGSDDTEYALFNARLLLRHNGKIDAGIVAEAWKNEILPGANSFKGAGFSEMLALRNLKEGLFPPWSGEHVHSWSDGLAMRVAPFGIVAAGDPSRAAHLALLDGSVTHAGEGIYAGQSVAAAVAVAMGGGSPEESLDASLAVIPEDSWTHRAITRGRGIGEKSPDVWSALRPLYDAIVVSSYFWSDIAPEAVGLAFGVLAAARGDFRVGVLGAVNVGRDTDTIAAIVGSILGAGGGPLPAEWKKRIGVSQGTCIAAVRGMDIAATAVQLSSFARMTGGKG